MRLPLGIGAGILRFGLGWVAGRVEVVGRKRGFWTPLWEMCAVLLGGEAVSR